LNAIKSGADSIRKLNAIKSLEWAKKRAAHD
jgi:hypothetical protein